MLDCSSCWSCLCGRGKHHDLSVCVPDGLCCAETTLQSSVQPLLEVPTNLVCMGSKSWCCAFGVNGCMTEYHGTSLHLLTQTLPAVPPQSPILASTIKVFGVITDRTEISAGKGLQGISMI